MTDRTLVLAALTAGVLGCAVPPSSPPTGPMSFFVTSTGLGKGGDLGGLEGADRHCQALAQAAGAGGRTWRAYLSSQAGTLSDPKVVHARDRIGPGPWFNVKGVLIARNVDELHSDKNNVTKETALTEKGGVVNGAKSGSAMTGHHDRRGPVPFGWALSWNSAHPTLACDPDSVRATGGDALFYCFAEK